MCNSTDIDGHMKVPTNPLPVDPKGETLLDLCEKEDAILEATVLMIDNQLPY